MGTRLSRALVEGILIPGPMSCRVHWADNY